MELYNLGSGSSGNCYVIKHNNECIMLECGFEFKKLVMKLHKCKLSLTQIKQLCITHYHNDHCKALAELESLGIKAITPEQENKADSSFEFVAFPVAHDIKSIGFVITNKDTNEKILFINDTSYCELPESVLNGQFDYIFIECNHLRSKLKELIETASDEKRFKYERQIKYHLSLAGTKKILKQLDLSKTEAIYLMHLSQEASDPKVMKEQIEYEFKLPTYVCGRDKDFI